jgi:hypothetical protein
MEQESKNISLPKQFDKLTVEKSKKNTLDNEMLKKLSLKQRDQLGIRYLSFDNKSVGATSDTLPKNYN